MDNISLSTQLDFHLRANHYPPVPSSMVQPCIDAIVAYNDGDSNKEIELPQGISWRGEPNAPAYAIIEAHHLEAWLSEDYYV